MKLYLDTCALKRPFDDRSDKRVDVEAAAVLALLVAIEQGEHRLVWSSALTFENEADPDDDVRSAVARWASVSETNLRLTPAVRARVLELWQRGLSALDAAHLAFAEAASCDALVTCDDRFVRKALRSGAIIRVVNPLELLTP